MEIFLLLLDDLDDLFHAFRLSLPKLFGFLAACSLFGATVFTTMRWPWLLIFGMLLIAVSLAVRSVARDTTATRLKTDP